jgi:GT2 family glycosyltransferase
MDAPTLCCAILAPSDGAAVLETECDGPADCGLVVVVSAETDVEPIRQRFRTAQTVAAQRPGWSAAANAALEQAVANGAEYVLFVDPGARVRWETVGALVRHLERVPHLAAAGSKNVLRDDPATAWGWHGRITWGPTLITVAGHWAASRDEPPSGEVDWLLANGCLVRTAHAQRIGGFDEDLFSGFAEADWCVRARQAGFAVAYVAGLDVQRQRPVGPFGSERFLGSPAYRVGHSSARFARKHGGRRQRAKLALCMALGIVLRLAWYLAEGSEEAVRLQWPFASGLRDGFRRRLRADKVIARRDGAKLRGRLRPLVDWIGA